MNTLAPPRGRLYSLDVLRGMTVAGMILVNNPGSWKYVFAPLRHAEWTGLTPTDLVFPFFMFIMGVSMWASLRRYGGKWSAEGCRKVLRRTVLLYIVGFAIVWLSTSLGNWYALQAEGIGWGERLLRSIFDFSHIRITGVLQRLAVCYGAAALIVLRWGRRPIPYIAGALLLGYGILLATGNGYAYDTTNILSVVDRAVLGAGHMYDDHGIDPEGILSTIPSIGHVLLGIWVGSVVFADAPLAARRRKTALLGAGMLVLGLLLVPVCPVSKKIWTPTFVLVTCALGTLLLACLIWLTDEKGRLRGAAGRFFEVFGCNPLFIYATATVMAVVLYRTPLGDGTLYSIIYRHAFQPLLGDYGGSLAFALTFVAVNWFIGWLLYRKKIFIKL